MLKSEWCCVREFFPSFGGANLGKIVMKETGVGLLNKEQKDERSVATKMIVAIQLAI